MTRQFPLTFTAQIRFRVPCNSCKSKPGRLRSRGSAAAFNRPRISRSRSACFAWIPRLFPVTKKRSSPLCRKLLIATTTSVTHTVTVGNPAHNTLKSPRGFVVPQASLSAFPDNPGTKGGPFRAVTRPATRRRVEPSTGHGWPLTVAVKVKVTAEDTRVSMPQKRYIVRLTDQEREVCRETVRKLNGSSEKVRRAQVLLKADADGPAWTDQQIADAFSCRTKTVENIRQRCVLQGFEQALERKRRESPPVPKLLNGEQEAQIIALRLGLPPKGYANWSLRLLARRVVELAIVESVSRETIRRTLKKTG